MLRVWQTETLSQYFGMAIPGYYGSEVKFTPDDKLICVNGEMNLIWIDVEKQAIVGTTKVLSDSDGNITSFDISSDGRYLVAAECKNMKSNSSICASLDVSNAPSCKELLIYKDHEARVFSAAIHYDNIHAVTGSHSGARIWNMTTGATVFQGGFCKRLGTLLFDSGRGGSVAMVELEQKLGEGAEGVKGPANHPKEVKRYNNHTGSVTGFKFIHGETRLVTCSEDGTIRVFDVDSEKCLYSFFHHQAQQYKSIDIHPDGQILVASNRNGKTYILKMVH